MSEELEPCPYDDVDDTVCKYCSYGCCTIWPDAQYHITPPEAHTDAACYDGEDV